MTGPDDTDLEALYRTAARETTSAGADAAVMARAQAHLNRRRATPFVAIAAGIVVAVLLVRVWAPPVQGAAPDDTRAYLMQLDASPAASGSGAG